MAEHHPLRRVLAVALVAALAIVFVAANHAELPAAWRQARHADGWWLAAMLACSLAALANHGLLHAASQRAAGSGIGLRRAVRLGAAGFALNAVAKSGGMAGLAAFLREARRTGHGRGAVTAGYVLAVVLAELAFAATLAVALVVIAVDGHLTRGDVIAGAAFAVLLSLRLGTVVAALRSRAAVRRVYALPRRLVARLRRRDPVIDHTAADELHEALTLVRRRPRAVGPAVVAAVGIEVLGTATLLCALAAVHASHRVAEALVAYAVSVLFGIVGFLPGGLGFVEASLGGVLVSFGAPVAQATAAVALYRIGELWLPLALGALASRRLGREAP